MRMGKKDQTKNWGLIEGKEKKKERGMSIEMEERKEHWGEGGGKEK